jgi:hypothetical protein
MSKRNINRNLVTNIISVYIVDTQGMNSSQSMALKSTLHSMFKYSHNFLDKWEGKGKRTESIEEANYRKENKWQIKANQ